jgi:hypothetical protein
VSKPAIDTSKPSAPEWRDGLLSFQAREIERAKERMEIAVGRGQMKPEVRDYVIKNMEGVYRALRRLDAVENALAAQRLAQEAGNDA